jgi:transcriptional regulator with XRE-family HTH domain
LTEEVLRSRRLPPPAVARAIRHEAGVSQHRLAVELGVHRVTVARWELGMRVPRGSLRLRYADALNELQREVLGS